MLFKIYQSYSSSAPQLVKLYVVIANMTWQMSKYTETVNFNGLGQIRNENLFPQTMLAKYHIQIYKTRQNIFSMNILLQHEKV